MVNHGTAMAPHEFHYLLVMHPFLWSFNVNTLSFKDISITRAAGRQYTYVSAYRVVVTQPK